MHRERIRIPHVQPLRPTQPHAVNPHSCLGSSKTCILLQMRLSGSLLFEFKCTLVEKNSSSCYVAQLRRLLSSLSTLKYLPPTPLLSTNGQQSTSSDEGPGVRTGRRHQPVAEHARIEDRARVQVAFHQSPVRCQFLCPGGEDGTDESLTFPFLSSVSARPSDCASVHLVPGGTYAGSSQSADHQEVKSLARGCWPGTVTDD